MKEERVYIAIDLKSFYASVECVERGLDPLTTNLVVADPTRTDKTICLAVSPSLKAYGISGRARLFEVISKVNSINNERLQRAPGKKFTGESHVDSALKSDPGLKLGYIVAPPQMAKYIKISTEIYNVYLNYIAPEDIHVYSIDEVFMDVTDYRLIYKTDAHGLALKMIRDVLKKTGITATAGIGTNLYLCKIAMDIVAKHIDADEDGVRIAELDEKSYRRLLWEHRPLTDFWRVGRGYAKKLESIGLYTMGDIAVCSLENESILYNLFGINAELLIDHAWGWEPCTIKEIKEYSPENNSISSGQVLQSPYGFDKARLVMLEMTDLLVLELVDKGIETDQIVVTVGYDIDNVKDSGIRSEYKGEIVSDFYGRQVPQHAHGSANLKCFTSSTKLIREASMELFDRIVNRKLLIRRLNITANHVVIAGSGSKKEEYEQMDIFSCLKKAEDEHTDEKLFLEKEKKLQKAELEIKRKFGKNAILKGMNFEEGATARERNQQIGGHKA